MGRSNGILSRRKSTLLMSTVLSATLGLGAFPSASAQDDLPSRAEMWEIIKQQQAEIETLKGRVGDTEARVEEADEKIEAAGDMIESAGAGGERGWWDRTHIGGYGELHYEGGDKDEIDFHRFVLFFGHEFNDRLRFESEVELEHALAGEGKNGEVELEQAYIEGDIMDGLSLRGGVMLIPVGILNETHEPPTFFGVERNIVENRIIPTTWWAGGVGARGELGGGFSYNVMVHEGLKVATDGNSNPFGIRGGRQKTSEASIKDLAATLQVKWTGYPGVEIGGSIHYEDDLTQNAAGLGTSAILSEIHTDLRFGGFGFRALYARWDLDNGPPITGAAAFGRNVQEGWYVEPSYRFPLPGLGIGGPGEFGVFARFARTDTEAGSGVDTAIDQINVGFNYWPHPYVVLKADGSFEQRAPGGGKDDNRLNLGVGYQF